MKRLLTLPLGVAASLAIDEEGATAILRLVMSGEVSIAIDGKLTPEAAVAASRALAKFAMRHLPESMQQEISDGIPTMSPEFETTGVGTPPELHRTTG